MNVDDYKEDTETLRTTRNEANEYSRIHVSKNIKSELRVIFHIFASNLNCHQATTFLTHLVYLETFDAKNMPL
jgi:hypothetical protein